MPLQIGTVCQHESGGFRVCAKINGKDELGPVRVERSEAFDDLYKVREVITPEQALQVLAQLRSKAEADAQACRLNDCRSCSSLANCAWCAHSGRCLARTLELRRFSSTYPSEVVVYNMEEYTRSYGGLTPGVMGTTCLLWITNSSICPRIENYCSHKKDCDSCLTRAGCGYCKPDSPHERGTCAPGIRSGELVMKSAHKPCGHKTPAQWIFGNWPQFHQTRNWDNMCQLYRMEGASSRAPSRGNPNASVQTGGRVETGGELSYGRTPAGGVVPSGASGPVFSRGYVSSEEPVDSMDTDMPPGLLAGVALVGILGVCLVYCLIAKVLKGAPGGQSSRTDVREEMEREARMKRVFARGTNGESVHSMGTEPGLSQRPYAKKPSAKSYGKKGVFYEEEVTVEGMRSPRDVEKGAASPRDIKVEMDDTSSAPSGKSRSSSAPPAYKRTQSASSQQSGASPRPSPRPQPSPRQSPAASPRSSEAPKRHVPPPSPPPRQSPRQESAPGRQSSRQQQSPRSERTAAEHLRQITAPILPPPTGLPSCAVEAGQLVYAKLLSYMHASDAEKKALLRELQRTWHPDKNSADQTEMATAVFQYINYIGPVFLSASRSSI